MENLTVMEKAFANTIDSREVAEMVDMEHKLLLRKIEGINESLGRCNIVPTSLWIEDVYKDIQTKERKCYNLTKRGCEFLSNKLTDDKGNIFTFKYVEKFNEMEQNSGNSYMIQDPIKRAERWIEEENEVAREHEQSEQQFNKLLNGLGIVRKVGGAWILRAKYTENGYEHSDGKANYKSLLK